jgi:hypothetical protein
MTGVAAMAGLLIEAADPAEVARFWSRALGGKTTTLPDGSVRVRGPCPELTFSPQVRPKSVKNRVHFDTYVRSLDPLLAIGARVLDEYAPASGRYPQPRVTMADVEGNEFCAFLKPARPDAPPARVFAVCTDSDRPEELAAWWSQLVGAQVGNGADGTPRWLQGSTGWPELIWKFVRVPDQRMVPNRAGRCMPTLPACWPQGQRCPNPVCCSTRSATNSALLSRRRLQHLERRGDRRAQQPQIDPEQGADA